LVAVAETFPGSATAFDDAFGIGPLLDPGSERSTRELVASGLEFTLKPANPRHGRGGVYGRAVIPSTSTSVDSRRTARIDPLS
jgi:hypothetical protein